MGNLIPDKSYFRIGEVSKILNVEPYVVRYWETEFRTIKPVRTRTSQRLYRKKDVEELLTIRNLLYSQRFTIDGAKKQLHKTKEDRETKNKNSEEIERLIHIKEQLMQIKEIFDK